MKEILDGIYTWSWFSPEKGFDFSSYMLQSNSEWVIIDPVEIDIGKIKNLAGTASIILTNRDHERIAAKIRDDFRAIIYAPELDAGQMELKPDLTYNDGDILPGSLKAILIKNGKSEGETALLWEERKILFIGDAIIGWPKGEFSLLPEPKYKNPMQAKESIRELLKYDFDKALVCDGISVLENPKAAIRRFLERKDVFLSLPVRQSQGR